MSHTETVKRIIEEQRTESVSKFYVIEEIKNRIHPTQVYNAAIAEGKDTDDGIENMNIGARLIFRKAMKSLKQFQIGRDGRIVRRFE